MPKWLIFTIILVLIGLGSFVFSLISFSSADKSQVEGTQDSETTEITGKTDTSEITLTAQDVQAVLLAFAAQQALENEQNVPGEKKKGIITSFLFPDPDLDRGVQKALTIKSEQIFDVWDVLKNCNGVINVIQSAHPGNSEFLVPVDKTMNKMSEMLYNAYGAIVLNKYLLFIFSHIILLVIIPIYVVISIIVICTKRDKSKTLKLVIVTVLVCFIMLFIVPISLQLSSFMEKAILSGNIDNLVTSIEEKGEIIQEMKDEITEQRILGRSVVSYIDSAKDTGNALIKDITNYYIIFVFSYIVFPILMFLCIVIITIYSLKQILGKKE
ncbi:MAG: hypothetical protein FWD13_04380 [Treponema sp.]|nr:hypothetical protein [Treponema sp.]